MNKSNALREALRRKTGDLPYGFELKMMERIHLEARRKSRRSYYRSLGLVTAVSLAMAGGALYAMYHYFSFNIFTLFAHIPERISSIGLQHETGLAFAFYGYIALLIMLLLGLDNLFRRLAKKRR